MAPHCTALSECQSRSSRKTKAESPHRQDGDTWNRQSKAVTGDRCLSCCEQGQHSNTENSSWMATVYRPVFWSMLPFQVAFGRCSDSECVIWPVATWGQQPPGTKGRKPPGRVNCVSPALMYRCPSHLHFATVRAGKRGLCPHPCSVVLGFKIYFGQKTYRESSIHCTLISSFELEYILDSVRKKIGKLQQHIDMSCKEEKAFANTLCQMNHLYLLCYQVNRLARNCFPL